MKTYLAHLAPIVLSLPIAAQDCSDLTVVVTVDEQTQATNVAFDLTGSLSNATTWLVLGQTPGQTSIPLGSLGTLDLGLVAPFVPVPVGMTDFGGDLSIDFDVPLAAVGLGTTLYAQAVSLGLEFGGGPPTLTLCTSGVESLDL